MGMMVFEYTARDTASGKQIKAQVQADSEQSAAKLIKQEGLVAVDIRPLQQKGLLGRTKARVRTKDRVLFSRQLSTLINAGLPLVQALRSVAAQTTSKSLLNIIGQIISDIEAGATFSSSLAKHPRVFNKVYISLIAAGETSGTLDQALERLANQQEKDADIIAKVRGAMVYPIIVLVVMLGVVVFMLVKVLPQVETLYQDIGGATLPLVTIILLKVSNFITSFWWIVIVVLVFLGFVTSRWARTLGGKNIIDKAKMRAWPIGTLFMKMYMARFSRTGATLISSGVPLIQVMDITGEAVDNVHIQNSLKRAEEKVRGGKSLGDSLSGDPNFLDLVPNMLKIGEQSGSLQDMMAKSADYYEKELDNEIKNIQTIIEPVMMILMGVMAFTIVAAVLLPIYNLASQAGGTI